MASPYDRGTFQELALQRSRRRRQCLTKWHKTRPRGPSGLVPSAVQCRRQCQYPSSGRGSGCRGVHVELPVIASTTFGELHCSDDEIEVVRVSCSNGGG